MNASTLTARRRLHPVACAALLALHGGAQALPEGGRPVFGSPGISRPDAATLLVRQSTPRAGIDWTTFSIDAGETVRFVQPDRQAVIVNRVTGGDPSRILGRLQADGRVFLVNPRGIVFGQGAQVDVGGLVASSLPLSMADAVAGRWRLGVDDNAATGEVRNEGRIQAHRGTVVLVGTHVDNRGQIEGGRIGLAAAQAVELDLDGDGLIVLGARAGDVASLSHSGRLQADGGRIELRAAARGQLAATVLNVDGAVRARGFALREGRVVIDGGAAGVVAVGGQVDARGTQAGERGGAVDVLGDRVALAPTARIDASGEAGGGRIRVGGDYQGANAEVANAKRVVVQAGAVLAADAVREGPGGRVIVWSDEATAFAGSIQARGGASGGDGGFAEVSGKAWLGYTGRADLGAQHGTPGVLLLDPLDLTVGNTANIDGTPPNGDDLASSSLLFGDFTGASSQVTDGAVEAQLQAGGGTLVRLQATNNITITQSIVSTSGTLELRAGNNISVGQRIDVPGGVSLIAADATSGAPNAAGAVSITGGNVSSLGPVLIQGAGTHVVDAGITVSGSTITVRGGMSLNGVLSASAIGIESGTLTLGAASRLAGNPALGVSPGATLNLASFANTVASLSLGGTLAGSGTLTAATYALNGGTVDANLGAGALTSDGASRITGNAALTGTLVRSGTLTVGNGGIGAALSGGKSVAAGATLRYDLSGSLTLGTVDGAGTVEHAGSGTLTIDQAVNVSALNVASGGTVVLGASERLADVASVSVAAGGRFDLGSFNETIGGLALSGTLAGSGQLTAVTSVLNGGVVDANLRAGTLTSDGTSRITGNAAATSTVVRSGTLTVGNGVVGSLDGGKTVDAGATLRYDVAGPRALGAVAGTGTVEQAGSGTLTIEQAVNVSALNVTGSGTVLLGAPALLSASTVVGVGPAGTFDVAGFGATVGSLTLAGTLNGSGTLSAATYALNGGIVNANLGAGALTSTGSSTLNGTAGAGTVGITGGTLTLGASNLLADGAAVTVAPGAVLDLGTNSDTVGSLALAGTLNGSGTLSAATYALTGGTANANLGTGALTSTGSSTLNGTAGAGTVGITGGTLTLGASNLLADGAAVTVASGAVLDLGTNSDTVGSLALVGTLNGSGTLSAATYALNGGTANANLGTGVLTSTGSSTLNGTAGASTVGLTGGTLTLDASNRLADGAAVTVAPGAVLNLGTNSDTVASLTLAGTLNGSGTLSAATYSLNGGTVNANLGAGVLTSTGSSTLNGTAGAATVGINGGTLTLGASNRLADGAAVTVAAGAALNLGTSSDTVGSLSLAGTLAGSGTLSAASYALNSGTVDANLGAGALTSDGASLVTGNAAVTSAVVQSGTLTVGNGAGGSLGGTKTVNAGSTLRYNVSGPLALGAVGGTGTVEQAGSGTLTVDQAVNVSALNVTGSGTALLGAPGVLSNSTAVGVGSAGTFDTAGFSDTVRSLTLAGTLNGSGTLTAATYALNDGTVNANLGAGVLTSTGSSTLNGTASAGTVGITGGTLTLGASNRLAGGAAVTVAPGGALNLGTNSDSVGSLALAGTLAGSGTLNAASYALNGGTVDANLGTGALTSTGSSTLNGRSDAATVQVTSGLLKLGANDRLATNAGVTVARGATLDLTSFDAAAARLDIAGALAGGGRFSASTYALDGATIDASLGAGALTSTGDSRLNAGAAVTSASVLSGVLTVAGSTLQTARTVAPGAVLRYELASNFSLGDVAGTGTLEQAGRGTLTVDRPVSFATLAVTGPGTLALGSSGVLPTSSTVDVRSSDGRFDVGSADARIGRLQLAGTLAGSGRLSTAEVQLSGGRVLAPLFTDRLDATGANSQLEAGLEVGRLAVRDGANLTLGTTARLVGSGTQVQIDRGGKLSLARDATIAALQGGGTLDLAGGRLVTGAGGGDDRFDGRIEGSGGLTKQGAGSLTLAGTGSYSGTTVVEQGRLVAEGGRALSDTSTLQLTDAGGVALVLGADETIGGLSGGGALGGNVQLGTHTLTVAGGAAPYFGTVEGQGGVTKSGAGVLSLAAPQRYTGTTRVDGGQLETLVPGVLAGGGAVVVARDGTMRLSGNESVQALSLAGRLEPGAGAVPRLEAGRYDFDGGSSGVALGGGVLTSRGISLLDADAGVSTLRVQSGELTIRGAARRLQSAPRVEVDAGATLTLASTETVGVVVSNGVLKARSPLAAERIETGTGSETHVGSSITTRGDQRFAGVLALAGAGVGHRLVSTEGDIDAQNSSNQLGVGSLGLSARSVRLHGGSSDLMLDRVQLSTGASSIEAGRLVLAGDVDLAGGSLVLTATAPRGEGAESDTAPYPGQAVFLPERGGHGAPTSTELRFAAPVLQQRSGVVRTAAGSRLTLQAAHGGGIELQAPGNELAGAVQARAGTGDVNGRFLYPKQLGRWLALDRVWLSSGVPITVGAQGGFEGLAADHLLLRAPGLNTEAGAVLNARLPFTGIHGNSPLLPALMLDLGAMTADRGGPGAFGSVGRGIMLAGGRPTDFGGVLVGMKPAATAELAQPVGVYLVCNGGGCPPVDYQWGGRPDAVPVFYNGVQITRAPYSNSAISSNTTLLENARRALFEAVVRTENVAPRLRAGVIAEVGAGRPATEGEGGVRRPDVCRPAGGATLACADAP